MHTTAVWQHRQHAKLGFFLALSLLLHSLLMLTPGQPVTSLQIPAPELVLTSLNQRPASAAPRHAVVNAATPAGLTAPQPVRDDEAGAVSDAATANHLRSLLHAAIDRHFVYPAFARRQGWEGRVEILVRLEQDGRLQALRIVRSSGYPILDDDALLTLRRIGSLPQAQTRLQGYSSVDIRLPILYRLTES
jgi:protein TonB